MYETTTSDGILSGTNWFRYSRPDMYLTALNSNYPKYINCILGGYSGVECPVRRQDLSETVPAMVRNLVRYNHNGMD